MTQLLMQIIVKANCFQFVLSQARGMVRADELKQLI